MRIEKLKEAIGTYSSGSHTMTLLDSLTLLLGNRSNDELILQLANMGADEIMKLSFYEMRALRLTKTQIYKLKAAIAFCENFQKEAFSGEIVIRSPQDAAHAAMRYLKGSKQEHFVVMYLDTKNQVRHTEVVSKGTLNSAIVHPREVYRPGIKIAAASIICIHNHPSNHCTPSPEDIEITKRLVEAGHIIGVEMMDHVIVSDNSYISLREKGYM